MSTKKITADELGLHLSEPPSPTSSPSTTSTDYFKWFLACLLFGNPIQQSIAKSAYNTLIEHDLTTPDAIVDAGWDKLVEILDEAHYARYDYSTATKLLNVCGAIKEGYDGSFERLLEEAGGDRGVIEERLKGFKGVGPKTVEIFLRDAGPPLGI
ncbi:hypothetical protein AJ79_04214 [Helicocarpus griseus UAMH5409]|uniref:HhH-GPD domain-containing protein n=1 Tax=Helicocarpus griseus UAMH5409 TaxID=1447875 RepID=A0A2B7XU07_9EURO|nr:hypothetical protein AJ79_04214 [Helicocarpus griseus UAMH5409]